MDNSVKFPAILIDKNNIIHFVRNNIELTTCSVKSWKKGYFNNLIIIDSMGFSNIVEKAVKVGYANAFFGLSLLYGQRIKVKLIFKNGDKTYDIDNFKTLIIKKIIKDKYFWNSGGNYDDIIKEINDKHNIKDIIVNLSNIYYNTK
jgi:hypothetical protein